MEPLPSQQGWWERGTTPSSCSLFHTVWMLDFSSSFNCYEELPQHMQSTRGIRTWCKCQAELYIILCDSVFDILLDDSWRLLMEGRKIPDCVKCFILQECHLRNLRLFWCCHICLFLLLIKLRWSFCQLNTKQHRCCHFHGTNYLTNFACEILCAAGWFCVTVVIFGTSGQWFPTLWVRM